LSDFTLTIDGKAVARTELQLGSPVARTFLLTATTP
jgi:hypothetical protein